MDTADVAGSKSKYETPDARFCDISVGEKIKGQGKFTLVDGANGQQLFEVVTDKEGKRLFPTIVSINDKGRVVVTYKQNGEIATITLDEYASERVIDSRKRNAKAVPSKRAKPKAKGSEAR